MDEESAFATLTPSKGWYCVGGLVCFILRASVLWEVVIALGGQLARTK
jgi:hypothetical protein